MSRAPQSRTRRAFLSGTAALALAACTAGGGGPSIDTGAPVPVALLVPGGSGAASDELLARSLENAARMAVADLNGVRIDLRVYQTAGNAGQAEAAALRAVDEGAKIILGPVYAQEANAAGVAVAGRGINVLSFSNNVDIAGGNVFVLGITFRNIAQRLGSYAVRSGSGRVLILHDRNAAGEVGRDAIAAGVQGAGGAVVGTQSYEFSQNGIVSALPAITGAVRSSGAQAIFFTATNDGALPLLTQLLTENGVSSSTTRFFGLSRWDVPPASLTQPGIQGGYFALPDPALFAQFQARYTGTYGEAPHAIAGLAYDGIAAVGALVRSGNADALTQGALTQGAGFAGVGGVFRLRSDGTNERALAVAQIQNSQVVIIDPAPRSFGGAGS